MQCLHPALLFERLLLCRWLAAEPQQPLLLPSVNQAVPQALHQMQQQDHLQTQALLECVPAALWVR